MRRPAATDAVAIPQSYARLAIQTEIGLLRAAFEHNFDLRGIGRSVILLIMAVAALGTVQSASVQLEIAPRLLLLAVALLLAASAFVAARAVGVVKEA